MLLIANLNHLRLTTAGFGKNPVSSLFRYLLAVTDPLCSQSYLFKFDVDALSSGQEVGPPELPPGPISQWLFVGLFFPLPSVGLQNFIYE